MFDRGLPTELAMPVVVWIAFSQKTRGQILTMTAAGVKGRLDKTKLKLLKRQCIYLLLLN